MKHPGPASIDCGDCQKWVYDLATGRLTTARVGPDRKEVPVPRPPKIPTPCDECPKGNPQRAKELELSPKNRKTYQLWRRAKATGGHCIPEKLRGDPIIARNFAELDSLTEAIEQARQSQMITLLALGSRKGT